MQGKKRGRQKDGQTREGREREKVDNAFDL